MARKKKVEEISEQPRVRLVRPAAFVEIGGACEDRLTLYADGRVGMWTPRFSGLGTEREVSVSEVREALALLDALEQVS